jgi:hypothetical protein
VELGEEGNMAGVLQTTKRKCYMAILYCTATEIWEGRKARSLMDTRGVTRELGKGILESRCCVFVMLDRSSSKPLEASRRDWVLLKGIWR